MSAEKPLGIFPPPTGKLYLDAVSQCIKNIQAEHDLDDIELADKIGCEKGTVENARCKRHEMRAVTLLRIAFEFGPEAIAPVTSLYQCNGSGPQSPAERIKRAQREIDAALGEMEQPA